MKKSVSILGCGWFGFALALDLKEKGYAVNGSSRSEEKLSLLRTHEIEPFQIELENILEVDNQFWESELLVITLPPTGEPISFLKNVEKLAKLIASKPFKQIIVISSTSVYPNTNAIVVEEDASYDTRSRSGVNLLSYEDLLYSDRTCIVRFGGLFGDNRHPVKFLSGKEIGGGTAPVNLIHRSDCIGITNCLLVQGIVETRLNACHPDHPKKKDYYTQAAALLDCSPPVFNKEPSSFKIVSSDKLIQQTGYQFTERLPLS